MNNVPKPRKDLISTYLEEWGALEKVTLQERSLKKL